MLQIKTIVSGNIPEFDKEVNDAIADGWRIVKRDCLIIATTRAPMLYAELEKEILTDDERTCKNCKHQDLHPAAEPCFSCSETCSEWEADV